MMTRKEINRDDCGDTYEAFERAVELVKTGDLDEAEQLLTSLASAGDYQYEARKVLGTILLRTGRFDQAVDCFAELISESPGSESASLGLFHALWELGKTDEAFAEMRRYRATHESMEYRRLLRDLKAGGYAPPEL